MGARIKGTDKSVLRPAKQDRVIAAKNREGESAGGVKNSRDGI